MTLARQLPTLLLGSGAVTVAGALAWWTLSYWKVWTNDYLSIADASRCLVADSSICRLATSLCTGRHAAVISGYSPIALWAGVAITLSSLLPNRPRPAF